MAKPRKSKNEEAKPDNSVAVVRHQKLCLSIDVDKPQIYGYTELEVTVPDIGIVGLFAENLGVESVLVDGEPAEFEYYPMHQNADGKRKWTSVSDPSSAADAAISAYISSLKRELVPNLLINCCKAFIAPSEQQDPMNLDNGLTFSDEAKQNVKLVRINYSVDKAEGGIHFSDNVLHTDNQIRRARCWFPCIDEGSRRCCYDMEFTVANNLVAVSTGTLLYQVLSKDLPPLKTYVYRLDVPVTARWISLAVGPFEILADSHVNFISHMCLPSSLSNLQHTVEFFHNAFNHYEEYLDAKFPFGSYSQVFLPPEMTMLSSSFGASVGIFSSHVLYNEKIIDQAIDTSIKLAFALAKQWFGIYITPEEPSDEWLLDGLAGFLTDLFIKKFLGNNEARYRRFKANCAVCKADDSGATALSSSASCEDLYGTHCIGSYGKIRSWKSVAILQILEKQMGPESFRKILQKVVSRAQDATPIRSLSTKEFRHFATKVGNLERPFVKEFFPRWVSSCGCPVLRMGFSYNKRKNMVELAVLRECTAPPGLSIMVFNTDSENRDGDIGWPGMMSIRVFELDGMYDHPVLPLAGEMWQLLEIQCHSKLGARRFQKTKKGAKPDGAEENGDVPAADMRSSLESPLLWVRADPEMEYLAEIHFNQPVQMWINQLEKDGDVVAQAQAIEALEALPQPSFSVVNALNNFLNDSKAFWRVRIEAAFALANTAAEETDWAGLLHLVKFYKSRRFDAEIGLPKPNDFRDFPEYFVLEAIPHAVAMVRTVDGKSPREAIEFILQLLKYNDNTGNPYSDVYWVAALIQSAGELEFGQQSVAFLSPLLKRIDRLLQFDRLMPSHNGILAVSCIRTLTQIALKLSGSVQLDHVIQLIEPFQNVKTIWQVWIEASRALLDLEFHYRGIDAALSLCIKYLEEESSLRGQVKIVMHALRLCQIRDGSDSKDDLKSSTLVALLHLLEGQEGFNNIFLRHHLFCILQILAGRPPTLFGVPRDKTLFVGDTETYGEPRNIFAAFDTETKCLEPSMDMVTVPPDDLVFPEGTMNADSINDLENRTDSIPVHHDEAHMLSDHHQQSVGLNIPEDNKIDGVANNSEQKLDLVVVEESNQAVPEEPKEPDSISNSHEVKRPVIKMRVKPSVASSRAGETDNQTGERSQGQHHETDRRPSSSASVDAPQRISNEAVSVSNQNVEEVNSCVDHGSRTTASIGSAKLASDGDNFGKELQCTADSSKAFVYPHPDDQSSPSIIQHPNVDVEAQKFASLQTLSVGRAEGEGNLPVEATPSQGEEKEKKKKDKDKKRKKGERERSNDPAYLEHKRLKKEKKKEKKRKEKEMAKLLDETAKQSSRDLVGKKEEGNANPETIKVKASEASGSKLGTTNVEATTEGTCGPRLKIKIKSTSLKKV